MNAENSILLNHAVQEYTTDTNTQLKFDQLPQSTTCITFVATTFHQILDNLPSITSQYHTSVNPSDVHFHKQFSGLFKGKCHIYCIIDLFLVIYDNIKWFSNLIRFLSFKSVSLTKFLCVMSLTPFPHKCLVFIAQFYIV